MLTHSTGGGEGGKEKNMSNVLFTLWAKAAINEIKQNIQVNEKELRVTKEKKSTLALALKAMITVDKKAIQVYEDAIKQENNTGI